MKCLVLGGNGFLGSHLCDRLLAGGHAVRILMRRSASTLNIDHLTNAVEVTEGDFTNSAVVSEALREVDVAFHLICTTDPQRSNEDPAFDVASNVIPTVQFLAAAARQALKRVIFFSSGGTVYGVPQRVPIAESHPTDPICSYGAHKLMIEKYLALFRHDRGLDYRVLRISNVYGRRQRSVGRQGVVGVFSGRMKRGDSIDVWGDGTVVRDLIFVDDVMDAALALLNHTGPNRIFNIGGGRGFSLIQIIAALEQALQVTATVRFHDARACDVPTNILDVARAREELGWMPRTPFGEGLRRTLAPEPMDLR